MKNNKSKDYQLLMREDQNLLKIDNLLVGKTLFQEKEDSHNLLDKKKISLKNII